MQRASENLAPTEMWYFSLTNEAEEIDEYEGEAESYPELIDDDVIIIEYQCTIRNSIKLDALSTKMNILEEWKHEVHNSI